MSTPEQPPASMDEPIAYEPDGTENPPEGFAYSGVRGPFTTHNGPFFHKVWEEGGEKRFAHGFRVRRRHLNGHGIVHGGLLMSFCDGLLGTAVWRASGKTSVTMRLTTDFLAMARPGDWVEGTAHVTRATRTIAFAEAEIRAGSRLVMTGQGVFRLLTRDRPPRGA
jgi:uncharacterized protein (TIGR00369 family)